MQEQVMQGEFISKAREPRPFDTISKGAVQVCCQAAVTRAPQASPPLALLVNSHQKAIVHKGKFVIFNSPRNISWI